MYVRLDDWAVGARIAIKRSYEEHVTEAMRPFLTAGSVVVDIGANIGYYTLLAASQIGQAGKVIAFEPIMTNCSILQMSIQENGFENVVCHTKAVADTNKTVWFETDDSNASIRPDNLGTPALQVQAVALDTFLRDEPRIDLIKMDIEGAEGLALKGMAQLLQRHNPVIFTEFSPILLRKTSGVAPEAYLNELRTAGYELRILHRDGRQKQPSQSNKEIMRCYSEHESDHLDLMALPTSGKDIIR